MATFSSATVSNISTSPTTIATITQTVVVTGLTCANKSSNPQTIDIYVTRAGTNCYLVKGGVVPVGSTLVASGSEQKLVLLSSDALVAVASASSTLDIIFSYLVVS